MKIPKLRNYERSLIKWRTYQLLNPFLKHSPRGEQRRPEPTTPRPEPTPPGPEPTTPRPEPSSRSRSYPLILSHKHTHPDVLDSLTQTLGEFRTPSVFLTPRTYFSKRSLHSTPYSRPTFWCLFRLWYIANDQVTLYNVFSDTIQKKHVSPALLQLVLSSKLLFYMNRLLQ